MQLFDLHCDTIYECYEKNYSLTKNGGDVDLARGEKYDKYVQVFAVWTPDTLRGDAAWQQCSHMLQLMRKEEAIAPERIRFLRKGESLDKTIQKHHVVGIPAIEGGAALGGDLSRIDTLSEFGVKYLTLTWNGANELGNGCLSPDKSGLTPLGKEAVRRLRGTNILLDVSHLNKGGFWDVAAADDGVFIASHSNAAAVCEHPRNLTDEQFLEIARRGGLVGLNLCGEFLGEQTFSQLQRHLEHFLSLGGEDTVCFGCDMDGTALPTEWHGVSVMSEIYEYLYRQNYHTDLLKKVFFGNCYNFFERL